VGVGKEPLPRSDRERIMELDRCCTRVVSGSRGGVVIAAAVVVEDLIITIIAEVIMSKGMVDEIQDGVLRR